MSTAMDLPAGATCPTRGFVWWFGVLGTIAGLGNLALGTASLRACASGRRGSGRRLGFGTEAFILWASFAS